MYQALVAGRDYPNTYREFVGMFPDVHACTAYLTVSHCASPARRS